MVRRLFKNTMTVLLALMVSGMLTCCINDDIVDTTENSHPDGEYCMYFTFQSTLGTPLTRAGESFVDGEHEEHQIGETGNYALFFNEAGKLLLPAVDLRLPYHKEITSDNNDDNIEEAIYCTRFYRASDEEMPSYVLVVLNGNNVGQLKKYDKGEDINEILKEFCTNNIPTDIGFDTENDTRLFTMTNSVYIEGNTVHAATKIEKDKIQKLSDLHDIDIYDPDLLNTDKIVKVYVERMVSKFQFQLPKNDNPNIFQPSKNKADMILFNTSDENNGFNDDGSPKLKVKRWRIALTGWNMNALEPKSYVFKNIENKPYFDGWNKADSYRSLWCEDSHYNDDSYPWQFRKAIDYNLNYYQDLYTTEEGNDNKLRNFSFNKLGLGGVIDNDGKLDVAATFSNEKIIYTPENTYDPDAVKDRHDTRDELLACTHLLVGAELQIEGDIPDTYYTPDDLFRDRDGFFYESERACIASLVHNFNQVLISNDTLRYVNYDWNKVNAEGDKKIMAAATGGGYGLYYLSASGTWKALTEQEIISSEFTDENLKMPIATIRRGDGKRLPWIEELINENRLLIGTYEQVERGEKPSLTVYDTIKGDYGVDVADENTQKEADTNNIKSLLYEWLGAVDHFNKGKMYYSQGVLDNPIEVENGKTPRYGVVRNKWYNFNLTDVNSLGTPVDDPDQPIVPEQNGLNDEINFTIKIIDWHTEETTTKEIPN